MTVSHEGTKSMRLLGDAAAECSIHWVVGLQQHQAQGRPVRCDLIAPRRFSHDVLFIPLRRSYRHVYAQLPTFPWVWETMRNLLHRWKASPTYYPLRMAMLLATLEQQVPLSDHQRVLIIGDGQGILGALLKAYAPHVALTCVDLPPMLEVQEQLHRRAGIEATYYPAQDIDALSPHSLAVSSACFPELTPDSRTAYFALLRRWGAMF